MPVPGCIKRLLHGRYLRPGRYRLSEGVAAADITHVAEMGYCLGTRLVAPVFRETCFP